MSSAVKIGKVTWPPQTTDSEAADDKAEAATEPAVTGNAGKDENNTAVAEAVASTDSTTENAASDSNANATSEDLSTTTTVAPTVEAAPKETPAVASPSIAKKATADAHKPAYGSPSSTRKPADAVTQDNKPFVSPLTARKAAAETSHVSAPAYGLPSTMRGKPADPKNDAAIEKPSNAKGIGGYHSVSIPLSDSARGALERFKANEINWVSLEINAAGTSIEPIEAKSIDSSDVASLVKKDAPRFYIYSFGQGEIGRKTVFIYCCPGKSPPKLRMVYSTAKQHVIDAVAAFGVSITKKIESADADEVTGKFISDEVSHTAAMPSGGSSSTPSWAKPPEKEEKMVKPKVNTIGGAQHPVYSLMLQGKDAGTSTTKKKVVIPPSHAYG
eukprot:Opistho-2@16873